MRTLEWIWIDDKRIRIWIDDKRIRIESEYFISGEERSF